MHLYGVPHVVLHDPRPKVYRRFLERTVENLRLQNWVLVCFHPQTDGQMERQNRTLEQVVHALGHEHGLSWLEAITLVEMTLNNAVNDSMHMSPAFISYCWPLHMPVNLLDRMLQFEAA